MVKSTCTAILKMNGWKFINNIPDDLRSFVMIGAPHTSNYDFFAAMMVAESMKRNAKFVIKSEWMKFPFNMIMGPAGAIGLDRKGLSKKDKESTTDLMAGLFKKYKDLVLMIAPEGTRSPNPHWKTGFYYMAQKAGVPIVLGFVDYEKKETGLGMVLIPTDFEKDMHTIMDFYRDIKGKVPDNFQLDEKFK